MKRKQKRPESERRELDAVRAFLHRVCVLLATVEDC